jgi:hypothetical protein
VLIADDCETMGFDYNDTENDAAQEDADVDFSFNEVRETAMGYIQTVNLIFSCPFKMV